MITQPPSSELYIPSHCRSLAEITTPPQIRLLIQGYPGSGKTWSALTFKNPIVINLDRGLGAHVGRADVIEVPLYDINFVRKWMNYPAYNPSQLKEAIVTWLDKEGIKLTANQTLIFDGCTGLQNAYHNWFKVNQNMFITKKGEVDGFAEWTVKRQYFGEIMEKFKTFACDIIFITHEVDLKDKNGVAGPVYSGKIRPLVTGSFGDELGSHFTDVFRAMSISVPADLAGVKESDTLALWGMTKAEYVAMCQASTNGTLYYWQTTSDSIVDAKASSCRKMPKFVPATYDTFVKYRKEFPLTNEKR